MDTNISSPENKLQSCVADSWTLISLELKNYCDIVNLGQKNISLIVAHETTLSNVSRAQIYNTELYGNDHDISSKLQFCIRREILSEETAVANVLKNLQTSYTKIMGQIDKVFSLYKCSDLKIDDLAKESLRSLSIVEMLETLDKFKRSFNDSHDGRKYSLECLHFTKNTEKFSHLWSTSELVLLKEELDSLLV